MAGQPSAEHTNGNGDRTEHSLAQNLSHVNPPLVIPVKAYREISRQAGAMTYAHKIKIPGQLHIDRPERW